MWVMTPTKIQHALPGVYESQIKIFSEVMAQRLRDNEHKGWWDNWRPTPLQLATEHIRLYNNLIKVSAAGDPVAVQQTAADIANIMMKLYFLSGGTTPKTMDV